MQLFAISSSRLTKLTGNTKPKKIGIMNEKKDQDITDKDPPPTLPLARPEGPTRPRTMCVGLDLTNLARTQETPRKARTGLVLRLRRQYMKWRRSSTRMATYCRKKSNVAWIKAYALYAVRKDTSPEIAFQLITTARVSTLLEDEH